MSVTTYERTIFKAISIDDQFIRRLFELIEKHGGKPTAKVWLSNDSTINELSVDELVALPNSKHRYIKDLKISTSYRDPLKVNIIFKGKFGEDTISYDVSGDEKDATYVSVELDRMIRDATRSISYFSSMPMVHRIVWWFLLGTIIPLAPSALLVLNVHIGAWVFFLRSYRCRLRGSTDV